MDEVREKLNELLAEKRLAQKKLNTLNQELAQKHKYMVQVQVVQELFQQAVKVMYSHLSTKLGDIITEGLSIVFPDAGYEFTIEFVERRGSIEADILLKDSDGHYYHPLEDSGGGVGDFVGLLLRCTYIILSRFRNTVIADEPLKFIDRDRIGVAAQFLRKFCEDTGLQVIMVTHIPQMVAESEVVYQVEKVKGVSTATRTKG